MKLSGADGGVPREESAVRHWLSGRTRRDRSFGKGTTAQGAWPVRVGPRRTERPIGEPDDPPPMRSPPLVVPIKLTFHPELPSSLLRSASSLGSPFCSPVSGTFALVGLEACKLATNPVIVPQSSSTKRPGIYHLGAANWINNARELRRDTYSALTLLFKPAWRSDPAPLKSTFHAQKCLDLNWCKSTVFALSSKAMTQTTCWRLRYAKQAINYTESSAAKSRTALYHRPKSCTAVSLPVAPPSTLDSASSLSSVCRPRARPPSTTVYMSG